MTTAKHSNADLADAATTRGIPVVIVVQRGDARGTSMTTTTLSVELPKRLLHRLRRLAVDQDVDVEDLFQDAVVLLLRYHDCGAGLVATEPEVERPGEQ